jgi:hypothetical protein
MKITLAQRGGLAAPINVRRAPPVVHTASLNADEAAELERLVADAIATPSTGVAPGKARDEMTYTITVEDEERKVSLTQSDTTMSEAFGKLLAWLQRRR